MTGEFLTLKALSIDSRTARWQASSSHPKLSAQTQGQPMAGEFLTLKALSTDSKTARWQASSLHSKLSAQTQGQPDGRRVPHTQSSQHRRKDSQVAGKFLTLKALSTDSRTAGWQASSSHSKLSAQTQGQPDGRRVPHTQSSQHRLKDSQMAGEFLTLKALSTDSRTARWQASSSHSKLSA